MNIQSVTENRTKRDIILETSRELFVKQGIQDTSMSQISKESKVAVGTIYHHFESKDKLIEELFLKLKKDFGQALELNKEEKKFTLEDKVKATLKRIFVFYTSNPSTFAFIFTNYYSAHITKDLRQKAEMNYKPTVDLILEGIKSNIFIEPNPVVLMRWIYNNIVSLVQLQLHEGVSISEEILNKYVHITWKSITHVN